MPDEPEVETKDLQEAIDEMHEEKATRETEDKKNAWVRYIGLSTAILAVFAAIGSLQAASLVNEAQIDQLKASDTWNEYQASKEKGHIYTIAVNQMLDAGITLSTRSRAKPAGSSVAAKKPVTSSLENAKTDAGAKHAWTKKGQGERLGEYQSEIGKEDKKQSQLSKTATELTKESSYEVENHEQFAYSVALIQVAIALGAVAALARLKTIWYLSMVCGIAGIFYFALGFRTIKHGSATAHRTEPIAALYRPSPDGRSPHQSVSPRAMPG
jgi:hypothetical protein